MDIRLDVPQDAAADVPRAGDACRVLIEVDRRRPIEVLWPSEPGEPR